MSSVPLLTRSLSPAWQAVRLLSRGHVGQVLAAVAAAGSAAATVATGYGLRHAHRNEALATAPKAAPSRKITLPPAFDGIPMQNPRATTAKAMWNQPGQTRNADWSYVSDGIRRLEEMLAEQPNTAHPDADG